MDTDQVKRAVAEHVTTRVVHSGMKIGLGTGSTAIHAVRRIGEMLASGAVERVLAVATSFQSMTEAYRLGIPLRPLNDPEIDGRLHLSIDGADEIDTRSGRLIKGGGAALTIEKLVEYNSEKLYIVADEAKLSDRIGSRFDIPVEIIPGALITAQRALEHLIGPARLRMADRKAGPVVTDNGNLILDVSVGDSDIDPVEMERAINAIPGVLENGLFTRAETEVWIGRSNGAVDRVWPE
jgi:ribose 5-phosphate isomerase A